MTWEEAVRWYRAQPGNEAAIRANYFDLPVITAARRYAASEEFAEVLRLLGPGQGRRVLDLGAGHGIASLAFAQAGWRVTAFEPDPSDEVGAGAIRALQAETGLPIEVLPALPADDSIFDAVFCRQVLHHVPDVAATMRELFHLLRSSGVALALREHVASNAEELAAFLQAHPLHRHYGGENAHPLDHYLRAATDAGFRVAQVWGPLESILNFHPGTDKMRRAAVRRAIFRHGGWMALLPSRTREILKRVTREDRTPGRIFSFFSSKP